MKVIDIVSLYKSLSWRIIATITTMIISYYVTGEMTFALKIGVIEVFAKLLIYYFHERVWSVITTKPSGLSQQTES